MSASAAAPLAASIAATASTEHRGAIERVDGDAPPTHEPDAALRRTARLVGALYLAIFVIAPFVYFYVPGQLVDDDAAVTAANISADTGLFKAGMLAETVIVGIEIILAGLLWRLFRRTSPSLAFSSSLARVGEAFIQTVNVVLAGAVLIAVERGGLDALAAGDRDALIGFLVDTIGFGVMVWGLLFGFHLFLLGVLVRRSGLLPTWIGWLLMIASVGYLAQSAGHVIDADLDGFFEGLVVALSVPGELAFAGYLLFRGVRSVTPSRPPRAEPG